MPLTGEEIRARLTTFAARWSVYEGTERSEAQTFLNQLFECYGTERPQVAHFEHRQGVGFLDLLWPRVCIVEMKAPSEANRLAAHRPQALEYWRSAADPEHNVPAPEWVVLCAFRKLEVWQPGDYPNAPRVELDLVDLPDQYDVLLFLAGREPVFSGGQAKLTLDAVSHLVAIHDSLRERRAAPPDVLRNFLLQTVWCLFAEDLGQIPAHGFTRVLNGLIADQHRSSADELGQLFTYLNTPAGAPDQGLYAGTPYANGGLFEEPARVHLNRDELLALALAAQFNWRQVQPSIFGALLQGGLGRDQQWRLGAHYTHEADIQKIVQPTIAEPWRERIRALGSPQQAEQARYDLLNYVVLDPACGSGNFLYVAYRELRRIEQELKTREQELRRDAGLPERQALDFFPLTNIKGIEIDGFAVALARVTLWMGHKLAVDELGLSERTLPLGDLSGIRIGDALRMDWPRADAIIGNPPFHGTKSLRGIVGDVYADWLIRTYGVGLKDFCVYWFRTAHDQLPAGGRAGLVGTNSIAEGQNRKASLDYIVANEGHIINAVSSQEWPGESNVHVAIVNWAKEPPAPAGTVVLDGVEVTGITTALRAGSGDDRGTALAANRGRQFFGVVQSGDGFVLDEVEAKTLLADPRANYAAVVKPFLVGDDIATNSRVAPRRWIIDFGEMPLEVAARWPAALGIVRERVKPARDKHKKKREREEWWKFSRTVRDLFAATATLPRFIACPATGKRFPMIWCEPGWTPSNATSVFAFADDYAFGVLSTSLHTAWARHQSTTLETRPRYTVASFATFPWPGANAEQRLTIGELAVELVAVRRQLCGEHEIGLTALYNALDDGAFRQLAALHRQLDEAVAAAYGWPPGIAQDGEETNRRLLELNREISEGSRRYDPFAYLR